MSRARSTGVLVVGLVESCRSPAASRSGATCRRCRPGQVGFDDMCGLQEYFDALEIETSPPPRVVSALDLEGDERRQDGPRRQGTVRLRERLSAQAPAPRSSTRTGGGCPTQVAHRRQDRDRGEVVGEGRREARHHRPGRRDGRRRRDLQPAVPRLPVRAAVRRAALSPAPRHVGPAAARARCGRDRRRRARRTAACRAMPTRRRPVASADETRRRGADGDAVRSVADARGCGSPEQLSLR